MAGHFFGGDWTDEKLERLRKYLCAYTTIFASNPRARYFTTIYVDAFAGTGYRASSSARGRTTPAGSLFPADPDRTSYQEGSARIALQVTPRFNQFLFIERSAQRVRELEKLRTEFPDLAHAIRIEHGDANAILTQWCERTNWQGHRAVVFLDPYGMEVNWDTIEALATTKAIDLWVLAPIGVAINRLLSRNEPPRGRQADALTRYFGSKDWQDEFYPKRTERTLFGEEETQRKDASFERIRNFFLGRLKMVFAQIAREALILNNPKGSPIYLLCFAAGNPKGAPTAIKIAEQILK